MDVEGCGRMWKGEEDVEERCRAAEVAARW